jgi:hypothetical protein
LTNIYPFYLLFSAALDYIIGTLRAVVFCICSLTLTVSKGIVATSAIDPEKEAVKADLIRKPSCDSSFLRIACIKF